MCRYTRLKYTNQILFAIIGKCLKISHNSGRKRLCLNLVIQSGIVTSLYNALITPQRFRKPKFYNMFIIRENRVLKIIIRLFFFSCLTSDNCEYSHFTIRHFSKVQRTQNEYIQCVAEMLVQYYIKISSFFFAFYPNLKPNSMCMSMSDNTRMEYKRTIRFYSSNLVLRPAI